MFQSNSSFDKITIPSANKPSCFPSLTQGRIPALNGWRAVCIVLVLLHHSKWVAGNPGWNVTGMGGLGVRFFFVLSGFLITLLMLREVTRNGKLNVKAFFKRRCLRILPVYYAFLAFIFLLQVLTPYHLPLGEWIPNLTFTKNYFGKDWTTGHLWSLAVEQQFYLLWPFVFRRLNPLVTPSRSLVWLAVPVVICPILWAIGSALNLQGPLGLGSFLINADALAVGCALSIILWHWGEEIGARLQPWRHMLLLAGIVVVVLPLWLSLSLRGYMFAITFAFPTLQNFGLALLITLSIKQTRCRLLNWLDWHWISFIGLISYSLYMWQAIFCSNPAIFGLAPAWWNSYPFWMLSSFLTAIASFYLIERSFLRKREANAYIHR